MKENEKTNPPFLGYTEPQEWNPPAPPWDPEPEPLNLDPVSKDQGEEEPVNTEVADKIEEMAEDGDLRLEDPEDVVRSALEGSGGVMPIVEPPMSSGRAVSSEFSEFTEEDNGISVNGLFFFMVKATTGITLNGVHFQAGGYWFDEEMYEGIEAIDAPFQEE